MEYININDYSIKINRKSKNKNIYLRLEDSKTIAINSPYHITNEQLLVYAKEYIAKIENKYDLDNYTKISYEDGGLFYYLGIPLTIKIKQSNKNIIFKNKDILEVNTKSLELNYIIKIIDIFMKEELVKIIQPRFATILNSFEEIPFVPNIKISKMKSRFGACYYKKNLITFSTMLLHYDYHSIDYVIIHELAHFIQPNHSKKFYYLIEKYMPDYKKAELSLKNRLS